AHRCAVGVAKDDQPVAPRWVMRLAPSNEAPEVGGVRRVQFGILLDRQLWKLLTPRESLRRVFSQPVKPSRRAKISRLFCMLLATVDEEQQLNAGVIIEGRAHPVEKGNERSIGAIIHGAIDEDRPRPLGFGSFLEHRGTRWRLGDDGWSGREAQQ